MRFLAILTILSAGFPGLGLRSVGGHAGENGCGHSGCGQVIIETTCCGEPTEREYCPMSGGPCRCAQAPTHDSQPQPEAPRPRSDRDSLVARISAPPRVVWVTQPEGERSSNTGDAHGLLAGRTHNEIQALLGVWRT